MLGDQHWKSGNLNESVVYYSNVVQALSGTEITAFNPDRLEWAFGFPFTAIILREMKIMDVCEQARALNEGIARGKLGMVLESLGREEEAQREYLAAAKLTGRNIESVKKLIRMLKDTIDASDIPSPYDIRE